MEVTRSIEVGTGGKIELIFPELAPGQTVQVSVVTEAPQPRQKSVFGRLKGKVKICDNFDDPIPGFEDFV